MLVYGGHDFFGISYLSSLKRLLDLGIARIALCPFVLFLYQRELKFGKDVNL